MPQKKRGKKISAGLRRSSKPVKLSYLEVALLGKGPTSKYKPLPK
jgi:hypothetical protein